MLTSIEGLFGPSISPTITFIILFAAILLAVLILIWLARRLLGGTLVSGGRSRQARLMVMDATPVDARRRLVLVRRDDVEHLILIGGPTDVVVEQNIRLAAPRAVQNQAQSPQQMREAPEDHRPVLIAPKPVEEPVRPVPTPAPIVASRPTNPAPYTPAPRPAPTPYAPPPRPAAPPVQTAPRAPLVAAQRPEPLSPYVPPRVEPFAPPVHIPPIVAPIVAAAVAVAPEVLKAPEASLDDMNLEDSLFLDLSNEMGNDIDSGAPEISLEDEMEQLLSTIDTKREKPL